MKEIRYQFITIPGKEWTMNEKKKQVERLQQYRTLLEYSAKQKKNSRNKE